MLYTLRGRVASGRLKSHEITQNRQHLTEVDNTKVTAAYIETHIQTHAQLASRQHICCERSNNESNLTDAKRGSVFSDSKPAPEINISECGQSKHPLVVLNLHRCEFKNQTDYRGLFAQVSHDNTV